MTVERLREIIKDLDEDCDIAVQTLNMDGEDEAFYNQVIIEVHYGESKNSIVFTGHTL